jgi:hypothetical protein
MKKILSPGRLFSRARITFDSLFSIALLLLAGAAAFGLFRGGEAEPAGAAGVTCAGSEKWDNLPPLVMPEGRYLHSSRYGWFDISHLDTGNPDQLLANVRAAAIRGGDTIAIRQAIREGITGYTGYYWVSGDLPQRLVDRVALAIYMDWSFRFEGWQGRPPRSLVGPMTSFAVEDLPSQYLGFVAAARDLEPGYIFNCYLGGVEASDEAPPHLLLFEEYDNLATAESSLPRLTNPTFKPMVETEQGWQVAEWPAELNMEPIGSESGLWRFAGEETWYLNQGEEADVAASWYPQPGAEEAVDFSQ